MAQDELIYGFHPVRETLRHRPHTVAEVLVAAAAGARRREIESLCARHRLPLRPTDSAELARLVDGVHNGFAARLCAASAVATGGDPDLVVLVEDVEDPRNLGALLRVCEGAGVGRVLIRDRGSAPLSATVAKTSAGASEWIAVERITNTARQINELKSTGFWIYGSDAGGEPPWQVDLTGRVALCFGGEARGLRQRTRALCDRLLGLPMRGRVESLNLSTAAAAILYEALRQRL